VFTGLPGPLVHGRKTEAQWHHITLLGAGADHIHTPVVHRHVGGAEAGEAVGDREGGAMGPHHQMLGTDPVQFGQRRINQGHYGLLASGLVGAWRF